MQQPIERREVTAGAVFGVLLIAVGIGAVLFRQAGIDLFESIGPWTWPFLVIVPGLVLLGLSLVPSRPNGIGFAIAGGIVTTVGSILLYQQRTGHWESWAYAWALIPLAAGLAQLAYGALARDRGLINNGSRLAGVATVLFLIGAWFFEGLFAGDDRMTDAGSWWPVAVIILGAVIALRAVLVPRTPEQDPGVPATQAAVAAPPREPLRPA